MDRAIKSENLKCRINSNSKYGKSNFGAWSGSVLNDIKFKTVLDLCCGTGNQLDLCARRPDVKHLTGVDLSTESLKIARQRLDNVGMSNFSTLISFDIDEAFNHPKISNKNFDLISCFYGLYYSKDPKTLLSKAISKLDDQGTILIVGPYGPNNKLIFNILENHFKLPELVIRSSKTFMEQEVMPILKASLEIKTRTFTNYINFPDPNSVLDYWRGTTFYNAGVEREVSRDIRAVFDACGEFVVTKHVMAIMGKKS